VVAIRALKLAEDAITVVVVMAEAAEAAVATIVVAAKLPTSFSSHSGLCHHRGGRHIMLRDELTQNIQFSSNHCS
jgi:hypothetical protein